MTRLLKKLTLWKGIAALIFAAGAVAAYIRITKGLGASTHLTDQFPWGIWIGFDILCGVGLAAGGFTLATLVYIFNVKRFEPIIRPTILTAFLGYILVVVGLLFDLGRPFQIWHAMIMWNHGLLTVGRDVCEAFGYMRRLVDACETQERLYAMGVKVRAIPDAALERMKSEIAQRRGNQLFGGLEWDMFFRQAKRLDPSFMS